MSEKEIMGKAMAVKKYFKYTNIKEFQKEWADVSEADRQELGELCAAELGIDLRK